MDLNNLTLWDALKIGFLFGIGQGIAMAICRFFRAVSTTLKRP